MKQIRKTSAKTRAGILKWISNLNPFIHTQGIYDNANIVALHIDKFTGALAFVEFADGSKQHASYFITHTSKAA